MKGAMRPLLSESPAVPCLCTEMSQGAGTQGGHSACPLTPHLLPHSCRALSGWGGHLEEPSLSPVVRQVLC